MLNTHLTLASAISLLIISAPSQACSLAFWNNNDQAKTVARSMDLYMSDQPTLVIYPRGLARTGDAGDKSIKWTSKYGSVALTAFHSNAVSDGMKVQAIWRNFVNAW